MTRVNLVPPEELYDQHLMAEYRELPMVPAALARSLKSKKPITIPSKFTLGKGHVTFFYDKGLYLSKRYNSLIIELRKRGFDLDPSRFFPIDVFANGYFNDWIPNSDDLVCIRERIKERISQKPHWYRKTNYKE